MNNREIQLWSYIDRRDSKEEREITKAMLASDSSFYALYQELLSLNKLIDEEVYMDEPSMSFTRKVMEAIKPEPKPVPLKTKVSNTIIYAIASVFVLTLGGLLVYAFSKADYNTGSTFSLESFDKAFLNKTTLYIFLVMDTGLLLLFLDIFLRKNLNQPIKKGN
jgi:hypothetical protein